MSISKLLMLISPLSPGIFSIWKVSEPSPPLRNELRVLSLTEIFKESSPAPPIMKLSTCMSSTIMVSLPPPPSMLPRIESAKILSAPAEPVSEPPVRLIPVPSESITTKPALESKVKSASVCMLDVR